jgi:hypothetical protein
MPSGSGHGQRELRVRGPAQTKNTKPTVLTTQTPTLGQLPINIKPHTYCQYQAPQLTTDLCQISFLYRVAGCSWGPIGEQQLYKAVSVGTTTKTR